MPSNMTKSQFVLWFMYCVSAATGCLTSTDRIRLFELGSKAGIFKDKKSFYDALYRLKKDGFAIEYHDCIYATDKGHDYYNFIANVAKFICDDAAFNCQDDKSSYMLMNEQLRDENEALKSLVAKLRLENENLTRDNESCVKQIDAIVADRVQLRKMYNDAVTECNRLNQLLDSRSTYADEVAIWANVAQQFANVARSFQR